MKYVTGEGGIRTRRLSLNHKEKEDFGNPGKYSKVFKR